MSMKNDSEQLIEQLIQATYGDQGSGREKHVFREALHALVRLAKAEQMLELKKDVRKAAVSAHKNRMIAHWKAD